MAKKRKPEAIYSELEVGNLYLEDRAITISTLRPGDYVKIGHPSNRYYEYISPSIDPGNLNISDLKKFRAIRGEIVKIISIITMANGDAMAVLVDQDWQPFFKNIPKIYAHLEKGFASKELLPLDRHTLKLVKAGTFKTMSSLEN
jgi:hypothetical protein